MTFRPLVVLGSELLDRLGHYDRKLDRVRPQHPWFIPVYHRIVVDGTADPLGFGLGVELRHFRRHLAYFQRRFHVCTIEDALTIVRKGAWPARPLLSITFDDGYLDNAELALPALLAQGCRATFFICTGPVAESRPFWWDLVEAAAIRQDAAGWQELRRRLEIPSGSQGKASFRAVLARLWQLGMSEIEPLLQPLEPLWPLCPQRMTVAHVKELAERGMAIAAHTHNHPNLTRESAQTVRREVARSKSLLEAWTGRPVTGFATPNGFVDERVKAACREAGIAYIASTEPGMNRELDPFHLARFGVANAPAANLKRGLTSMIAVEARKQAAYG